MKQAGFYPARLVLLAILGFGTTLGLSVFDSASAKECLTNPRQLVEKKVSDRWKERRQKDNQPLFLTISAGPGNGLQFVGKKPNGSTWISGVMTICSSAEDKFQVTLERIDTAPFLVGSQLVGMSDTISAGSSVLKFGSGKHCGNPDPCIEFTSQ
jgi:hypothetical protein